MLPAAGMPAAAAAAAGKLGMQAGVVVDTPVAQERQGIRIETHQSQNSSSTRTRSLDR